MAVPIPHPPAPPLPPLLSPQGDDPIIIDPHNVQSELYNILERDTAVLNSTPDTTVTITILHERIKPVLQRNRPMCGLVALCMADQLMHDGLMSKSPMELLHISQEVGYSKQGEILSSELLLQLAKDNLKCTGLIVNAREIDRIKITEWLLSRQAVLAPYDCDKDHAPFLANGHAAHWCIIVGITFCVSRDLFESFNFTSSHLLPPNNYFLVMEDERVKTFFKDERVRQEICKEENSFRVLTRQGKSRHLGLWSLHELMESCQNLNELGPHRKAEDYVLPEGNLKECLCSQCVLLKSVQ